MLFNSFGYGFFLVLVLAIYSVLSHRGQNLFLLGASYFFYSCWDTRFLLLIAGITAANFISGRAIYGARQKNDQRTMKRWLVACVLLNMGTLGFFKYFNFFVTSAQQLLQGLGFSSSFHTLQIILPVGISFFTFQALSYSIDIYKGKTDPITNIIDYSLFISFFPQLVAGPIERAAHLIPQIQRKRRVEAVHLQRGAYLILVGLVRKVVIADSAGVIADMCFAKPTAFSSFQLGVGLLCYSLQIYGDFAGYSNIARGSATLFGFDLMRNFSHPYFVTNITEFWRRWHISLSTWLRDYIYIPLGGNRKGPLRSHVNVLVTMLLVGLWHGANWNFILWGGLHGVYLSLHRLIRPEGETGPGAVRITGPDQSTKTTFAGRWAWNLVCSGGMFLLVSFTWLFFRATDLATTKIYLGRMAEMMIDNIPFALPFLLFTILTLTIDLPQRITDDEYCFLRLPPSAQGLLGGLAVVFIFLSGNVQTPFIYFQF